MNVIRLNSRLEELPRAVAWLEECCAREGIPGEVVGDLRLALDELLTNTIRHGYSASGEGEMEIRLERVASSARMELRDRARPFDPLTVPEPELGAAPEARPIGGLGVHLVRSLMDCASYAYEEGENRIVLERRWSEDP